MQTIYEFFWLGARNSGQGHCEPSASCSRLFTTIMKYSRCPLVKIGTGPHPENMMDVPA